MDRIVGIGEFMISNQRNDVIKTFALASCVAVTAYSRSKGIAGMIHMALPRKPLTEKAVNRVGYYVDTGLPIFINKIFYHYGCTSKEITFGLYGGADSIQEDVFKIGSQNIAMARKIFHNFNLSCSINETGKNISRTLYLDAATGEVKIMRLPIKI